MKWCAYQTFRSDLVCLVSNLVIALPTSDKITRF